MMKISAALMCCALTACGDRAPSPPAPVTPNVVEGTRNKLDAAQQEEDKHREEIDRAVK